MGECKSASRSVLVCESVCVCRVCVYIYVYIYTLYSLCVEVEGLLQVTVDFEAVVARIGDHNVSVRGESETLRAVQRVC